MKVQIHAFLTLALGGFKLSVTLPPALLWGKDTWYSFQGKMSGQQSRSGRFGKKTPLWLMPGIDSRFLCHSVQIVVTVPTELSWLQHIIYNDGQTAAILLFHKGKNKIVLFRIKKAYTLNGGLAPLIFKFCTGVLISP